MIDTALYTEQLAQNVRAVLLAHAEALKLLARQRVGKQSGRLARSIRVEERDGKIHIGTDIDYGRYLEFGTRHMTAAPWLMPSLEQIKPALKDALARTKPGS